MFTGIIQEVGLVTSLKQHPHAALLEVKASESLSQLRLGDSVAINGVCLTVRSRAYERLHADLSRETLKRSNLGKVIPGDPVNIELPVLPTTRLGGHFVQGHVDTIGRVLSIKKKKAFALFRFSLPTQIKAYVAEKGSITVDGISLTVSGLGRDFFEVVIIPHTLENTNLIHRHPRDLVNLEADVLAKYVGTVLDCRRENQGKTGITERHLFKHGY